MKLKEIMDFISQNMTCSLGRCIDNTPYVRGMTIYRADEKGIIFHTGANKDLCKQLLANPKVELCFHNNDSQNLIQVRVNGIATRESDDKLIEEIVSNRPFLKQVVAQYGKESLAVFRVKEMTATVWTWATNLGPKEYITIK